MENTITQSSAATSMAPADIDSLSRRFGIMSGLLERIEPYDGELPQFKPITESDMATIMPYLESAPGRTTDFSYGGLLMWVEYFKYEYAVLDDTLFIKGAVENDLSRTAFSIPLGGMRLGRALGVLKAWCDANAMPLVLSAVPAEALDTLRRFMPKALEELGDWSDYLYDAEGLAWLRGKKYSKKRNHVNQFLNTYSDWRLEDMTAGNAADAMAFMDIFDLEGDSTDMAVEERKLTRDMVAAMQRGNTAMAGAILYAEGKVGAFTIGDVKGDTLYVHIEKATRGVTGSYEAINSLWARRMLERHPEIRYINREDDSGDEGLRFAKESYHPVDKLKKYNVIF